ncbi:MAG TPA: putative lipid II flippase FtsW [Cryptosporangiaceae bacterium]|nr:putative lipid II flippase FtsW [Cryptosporangiaceae bacterium]
MNPMSALAGLLRRPMTSYYLLLASAGLLLGLGLIMVLSASSIVSYTGSGSAFTIFNRQGTWALVGLPAFWLALRMPLRLWPLLGWPAVLASAVMLALLPFYGKEVNGVRLWLEVGPVQVQPVEVAKLALALWGAAVLVGKRPLLTSWRHLAVPLLVVSTVLFALVAPSDFGGMVVLVLVLGALLWVAGVRFRVFAVLGVVTSAAATVLILASPERIDRLSSFRDPFADQQDTGFQAVRGFYSLATGGWFGVGLGQSREKWGRLPLAYNDFIYAVIGEELGVLGSLVVLLLFTVMTYAGLRIARRMDDPFRRLVASACTVWLGGQALINIGGVLGLLPITGLPLPLISAGGSALVITMFVIGMLASFARTEPDAVTALHARGRTWWVRLSGIPLPPLPSAPRASRPRGRTSGPTVRRGSPGTAAARQALRSGSARRGGRR